MSRLSTLVWMLVVVTATLLLYAVKYQVQGLRAQIAQTSRELNAEKESLHVVAAEWAYLNRPERLQMLANKYLGSTSITVDRVAEIEAIPVPKQSVATADGEEAVQPASVTLAKQDAPP